MLRVKIRSIALAALAIAAIAVPAMAAPCRNNTGSFEHWLDGFKQEAASQGVPVGMKINRRSGEDDHQQAGEAEHPLDPLEARQMNYAGNRNAAIRRVSLNPLRWPKAHRFFGFISRAIDANDNLEIGEPLWTNR